MADRSPVFSVVGAGLAGPLLAAYLGRADHRVRVKEMRPDPRRVGSAGGRSINLALSRRGLHALEEVGLADRVKELVIPMRGRMMHAVSGKLSFQPYGTRPEHVLFSVSRGKLNELLLDAAAACPGVELDFEQKCVDVDLDAGEAVFRNTRTKEVVREGFDIVVGADGAFSRVRAAMQRRDRFDFRQDYLEYGYKELSMPPTAQGDFALEANALHIWPRRTFMMIALPNLDRSFTCTLFWPFRGPNSFDSVTTREEILRFFDRTFPDVGPLIPDLADEFRSNPVGSLVTIRCRPWCADGKAVLLGDACHAVVPFYGQGMNAAFEDCTVLNRCLLDHAPNWDAAFRRYEELRKTNTDTLADLALANFVEMRDHVGSRTFLFRKWSERALHRLFPRWFVPLYSMITFSRVPYVEARRRARSQDRVVAVAGFVLAGLLALVVLLVVASAAGSAVAPRAG